MHLYLHVVTDSERIIDPDGQEFATLDAARHEACQSARELVASELLAGRPLPFAWHIQISDTEGAVRASVDFSALLFEGKDPARPWPAASTVELIARTREIVTKTQQRRADIHRGLGE